MPTTAPSPTDQALSALLSDSAPATIAEVVARMQAIDDLLANNDGLKWFNKLYLMVTQQVDLDGPAWQDAAWLTQLDVLFAGLYFNAVRDSIAGESIPSAWSALFEARFRTGVDRIQFALAGMNAHINHDLALALLATDTSLAVVPALNSPQHADFESVNTLLNGLMPATLNMLASDALGLIAEDTGKVGRLLAFWNICRARDLAWDFADHLRGLGGLSRTFALDAQDALTGALGRAILTVV